LARFDVAIVSLGARTPLGCGAAASAGAARAAIDAFAEHPFMVDRHGRPMVVAMDKLLDADMPITDRLNALVLAAAEEAIAPLHDPAMRLPIQLFLALPEPAPGRPGNLAQIVTEQIVSVLRPVAPIRRVQVFSDSHIGGHLALQAAGLALRDGFDGWCLTGGVDSWLGPETLEWLDDRELLNSPTQPFGLIPGEAATMLLLGQPARAPIPAYGTVVAAALDQEKMVGPDDVCTAQALTSAARAVLRCGAMMEPKIATIYSDMNGVPRCADEFAYALVRIGEYIAAPPRLITPAEWFGDVGAASVPLWLLLAAVAARKGYSASRQSLMLSAASGAERGAMLFFST
jgi:3-oxoacyl-[acyl-carrier-protein] synthase-1